MMALSILLLIIADRLRRGTARTYGDRAFVTPDT